jgi:hypothetical protein
MNFAEAMSKMFEKRGTVVICDSIANMSEEREPNFGTEIIGYAKLKTKGVCRITVDTCGGSWGKFRLCSIMCFDDMDMADETWRIVTIKERCDEILRRYPKEKNQDRDVSVITKERQERIKSRQIVSLEEVQQVVTDMVDYIYSELDVEKRLADSMGDSLYYGEGYEPDVDEPIPVAVQIRTARRSGIERIKESRQFEALTDICWRLSGEEAKV